ncbi:MAG: hypothetical protein SVY53_05055 [Chloroflexota bacterium]|nr:hypothetical protein [Chloroflexota bacterium]
MGNKAFMQHQIGKEVTHGTPVIPTNLLTGKVTATPKCDVHWAQDHTGLLSENTRSVITNKYTEVSYDGNMTFEQILYFLLMTVKRVNPVEGNPDAVLYWDGVDFSDYTTEVTDNNAGTHMPLDAMATTHYVYVGLGVKYGTVRVEMGANVNDIASVLSAEYSRGGGTWGPVTIEDTTGSDGKTFSQNGNITIPTSAVPSDWAVDTVDTETHYWLRLKVSVQLSGTVDISEMRCAGPAYTWDFDPSLTSTNNQDSFTLRSGDDQEVRQTSYVIGKSLEISAKANDVAKLKAEMFAKDQVDSSFVSGLALPAVEDAASKKFKLYINDTWASLGSTQVLKTLLDLSLKINSGISADDYCDGELGFTSHSEGPRSMELEMTFGMNTTAKAERAKHEDPTRPLRFVRLEVEGSEFWETTKKKATFDFCGNYDDFGALEESDSSTVVKVKMRSVYDPVSGKEFSAKVMDGVACVT